MKAAAALATTPSGHGTKKSASSAALGPHLTLPDSLTTMYPVTRTPSAPFPITRTPSAQGLAMIRTTEDSPPPTNLAFEEALKILYTTEAKLRTEVEMDIVDLKRAMTATKIDKVSRKATRLHTLRALLNNCRVLCRQEESVMTDFGRIKDELANFDAIEEEAYEATKSECLVYGGKLTDIKRRQKRLAGEAEGLCSEVASFSTFACPEINEGGQLIVSPEDENNFDMDRFKRESSTAPLTLLPTPSFTTYPMFNSAPYSSAGSSPQVLPRTAEESRKTTLKISAEVTQPATFSEDRRKCFSFCLKAFLGQMSVETWGREIVQKPINRWQFESLTDLLFRWNLEGMCDSLESSIQINFAVPFSSQFT